MPEEKEVLKKTIAITLTNGETRFPGQVIPKSHVKGFNLQTSPKLAKARLEEDLPKGVEVIVSGSFYQFNKRNYPLLKEYGVSCIYSNDWLVPILRHSKGQEVDTLKQTIYHPFKKNQKVGPNEEFWPIVKELS